jgi:hypothetical protein
MEGRTGLNKRYYNRSKRIQTTTIILCAILLLSPISAQSVLAQDNDLALSARIGFDGFCKRDAWLPIRVNVQNSGTDIRGNIVASYKNGSDGMVTTEMEIDLPATSHKEFFLYIYLMGNNQTINLSVRDGKHILKQVSQRVNCLATDSMIFGVLANEPSSYDVIKDIRPVNGYVRLAQLSLSDLPDRPQAWEVLDGLVVSNVDTGTFSPAQKQALQIWIASGGKLLVIGGHNWQGTTSGLADLMPVQVNTTRHVSSLYQLQRYVRVNEPLESGALLASGTLGKNSSVLVSQDQIPLLVQRHLGFGIVYFFAADPALLPLRDWDGMKDFYEHVFGTRSIPAPWARDVETGYEVNRALGAIPELGLPSGWYIWGLLILYILVIGPLNYHVLRRMKRRELGWITIPALVVLFTSLSYGTGFFYRGLSPTLNRLVAVQAWDGVEQANVHGLIGIYSPSRTKYDLISEHSFMFQPFYSLEQSLQANNEWHTLQQGETTRMPRIQGEIGDMNSISVQGNIAALEFEHDLVLTFSKTDPQLTGTITNKSTHTIRDALLATSDRWKPLGDFAPGETKSVNLILGTSSSGPVLFNTSTTSLLQINDVDIETNADAARRNAFLSTVLYSSRIANKGNWGIYLMGWADDLKLPVQLQDTKTKDIDTVLYVHALSPSIKRESGAIKLPSSIFTWDTNSPEVTPYNYINIPSTGYILQFRLGIPLSYQKINSLDIHLSSRNGNQDIDLSAWNYDTKAWDNLELMGDRIHMDNADEYVGPGGEVRIQVKYTGTNWTEIEYSYVTLEVE